MMTQLHDGCMTARCMAVRFVTVHNEQLHDSCMMVRCMTVRFATVHDDTVTRRLHDSTLHDGTLRDGA